jgi:hypothetical protein
VLSHLPTVGNTPSIRWFRILSAGNGTVPFTAWVGRTRDKRRASHCGRPYTLHPTPYTLRPTPCALNLSLNPQASQEEGDSLRQVIAHYLLLIAGSWLLLIARCSVLVADCRLPILVADCLMADYLLLLAACCLLLSCRRWHLCGRRRRSSGSALR